MSCRSSAIDNQGFTLVELVITLVILGFTLTMIAPFFQAIRHSGDPLVRERTLSLAQNLMEEVLSRRWDENTMAGGGPICSNEGGVGRGTATYGVPLAICPDAGPNNLNASNSLGADGGEGRLDYDDIDDYTSMVMETDSFTDHSGDVHTYAGYSRTVVVDYVASNSVIIDATTPASASTTDSKRVRVTVTNPIGEQVTLVTVVCNL